ncbi:hypothetical protein QVD17_35724 [Tagetes erecta]|uniref:Pectinesterase inhibitor domain-containing protein n=1 Tax=Tagetes erecta TaxID=13708 RepID=A0AAD8JTC1_TARER|nr:hypothetical protein QVD17_35724 [Tagetes erecta]
MGTKLLTILFLTILTSTISTPISPSPSPSSSPFTTLTQQNTYSTFIKTSCSSATYPTACQKSLLPYASTVQTNPLKLTTAALSATLKSANTTLSTVTHLSKTKQITKWEAAVLKDCIEDIKDSIDEIKSSIKEINGVSLSADKRFAISNAQTWTSAAITDENSCLN